MVKPGHPVAAPCRGASAASSLTHDVRGGAVARGRSQHAMITKHSGSCSRSVPPEHCRVP